MEKEQIEKALRGYYRTGCFHIYLAGGFDKDLSKMSQEDLGTFLHEYVHFLQNISTPYGIFEAVALNEAAVETFIDILPKHDIQLPYDAPQSNPLVSRLKWLEWMNGQSVNVSDRTIEVDSRESVSWSVIKKNINGREGRLIALEFYDNQGNLFHRIIGAVDIKEAMAAAYQSLIDPNVNHPDIPYNLLRLFCKQLFPSVGNDLKKFICLCFTSLFSLEPAFHFVELCHIAENEKSKTGFEFFDMYLNNHYVRINGQDITANEHFNMLLGAYSKSIKGLIRCDTPYIDTILERVRLESGNVPILNVINTNESFTVENVQMLIKALGIPYMHAQGKGWFFPAFDGQGASDVLKLVSMTWLYQFLVNKDKSRMCICPLVQMCGQYRTYCYDQPWLERDCSFELIGDEVGLKDKNITLKL